MEDNVFMLTTFDNPFNPFEDFETWWKEDLRLGHNCCGLLARFTPSNAVASEAVNSERIQETIDEIVSAEPAMFRKVKRSDFKSSKASTL